jgi:hypothetical protein
MLVCIDTKGAYSCVFLNSSYTADSEPKPQERASSSSMVSQTLNKNHKADLNKTGKEPSNPPSSHPTARSITLLTCEKRSRPILTLLTYTPTSKARI